MQFDNKIFFGDYRFLYAIDPTSGELVRRYRYGSHQTPLIANGTAYVAPRFGPIYSMDLKTGIRNWENFHLVNNEEDERQLDPVLSDGILFITVYNEEVSINYAMHALDGASGRLLWSYAPEELVIAGEVYREELYKPTAANGMVYVPSNFALVALDALSGRQIWRVFYRSICSPLFAADGVLYGKGIGSRYAVVFAIQAR